MGYKFQFITLAGFHQLNFGMFELARGYATAAWRPIRSCRRPSSPRSSRLHRDQAPARGRHRLFRRDRERRLGREQLDRGAQGIDRSGAVRRNFGRRGIREDSMGQRYWVIGGEYRNCRFDEIVPGRKRFPDLFPMSFVPRTEWQRPTFRDRCGATERYSICVEPVATVNHRARPSPHHCRNPRTGRRRRRGPGPRRARFPRRASPAVRHVGARAPPEQREERQATVRRGELPDFPRGNPRYPRSRVDGRRRSRRTFATAGSRSLGRPTPKMLHQCAQ